MNSRQNHTKLVLAQLLGCYCTNAMPLLLQMLRSIVLDQLVNIDSLIFLALCLYDANLNSKGTRDRNSAKEADDSFRPKKPAVTYPNGSDGGVPLFFYLFRYFFYLFRTLQKAGDFI